jgi:lysophospholipase L1-like esterase
MGRTYRRVLSTLAIAASLTLIGSVSASAAPANYTALGDSYASGVGSRTYFSDSGSCYRSPLAYPVLTAGRVGATLTFAACSGARIADVVNNQLGSLSATTTLVTVQVGGNDAGFVSVIESCARPWPWTCWGDIDNAKRFITGTLPGRLDDLYNQIRGRAPNAFVIVVGYPRLFNGATCNLGARISSGEEAELNNTADLLAGTISARAAAHGFAFADSREAFAGHAICASQEWLNGLSNPIMESYHPNAAGQSAGFTPLVLGRLGAGVPVAA